MMAYVKTTSRSGRRVDGEDELVILLPDPRLLRLVARSVLFAVVILSFPWLRCLVTNSAAVPVEEIPSDGISMARWVDHPLFFPMLIRDLKKEGLFGADGRRVFLGNPSARLFFLKMSDMQPLSHSERNGVMQRSVDFVMAADGLSDGDLVFVEKSLRIGGIVVVRLDSDTEHPFRLPPNYRIVYIRRFGSTIVAIKKTAHAAGEDNVGVGSGRKLLGMPGPRRSLMGGLEELLLEPPTKEVSLKRTKYLPDLMQLSLDEYPKRLFIDVGVNGELGSEKWFQKKYPKKNAEFEMVRLNVESEDENSGNARGISEWLKMNVRKEDFVVMKAEAEEVEVMMEEKTIGLVDELFLECKNEWHKGTGRDKAYWQCLALSGKLRDEGIAVHQWWD